MLKIELMPFEMNDLSLILPHPIRFVSLEFHHTKIEYCNLVFTNSLNSNIRIQCVRFKGKYFQSETILLPIESWIMNLTPYNNCCVQTEDPPVRIGHGIHPTEEKVTLRYAHI